MNNGTKKNILIVSDNVVTYGHIKLGLEYLYPVEYNVICVNYGMKCFEVKKNHIFPDVILLDISIPEMDGWEFIDYLKRNRIWRDIPIILITEESDKVAKFFGKIFSDVLIEKPFEIKDLKLRIDRVIKR
jgi:putative two-component system response regulator